MVLLTSCITRTAARASASSTNKASHCAAALILRRSFFAGYESDKWNKRFGGASNRQLPDFVEKWGKGPFYKLGFALSGGSLGAAAYFGGLWWLAPPSIGLYWYVGMKDIASKQAIRRNFPVLGHMRYILESIRPEIRQYFIEADGEAVPFSRERRAAVYQRAKGIEAVQSFGTRRNVYEPGYEWLEHSNLACAQVATPDEMRTEIGAGHCREPYKAAILNISAMSYGALSRNAILALNGGAKAGGFFHNTGEGGVSPWHLQPGGDICWNIGTGYFGCRTPDGSFSDEKFLKTAQDPKIKMIEVKLSQGAKPGHGGLLPASKLTQELADIRGVPLGKDVHSPANHTAFKGPHGLIKFMAHLRELCGKPVGFKICVGSVRETAALVHAMHELKDWPDFITIDGGEGGTGAAPNEFSNRVGWPLEEALVLVDDLLVGAGLRDKVKIICSGRIASPFDVVMNVALGADVCNSARAMMLALGCIQALKCNTNHCPTGITTQDPDLMEGLVVSSKEKRVTTYQAKVVQTSAELIAAAGLNCPKELRRHHIQRRINTAEIRSLADLYPPVADGCLLRGEAPERLQKAWDHAGRK
eukprot:TRINITY_DN20093_c0_g5_i1.p1 TRINITY_DN20093_c0_g5~~TRINITY_DN20093_c0_g5_i1.p1  ORF type:complete len:588 (-),score=98.79 TRINITY_DN20093_c0_g5_i1:229-1992(-)